MKIKQTFTFDDVLLEPQYSEILPTQCEVKTHFSRNVQLNIPIVSSAMDTVTESTMAIAMAESGGLGVIHKNLSAAQQANEVKKVKDHPYHEAGQSIANLDGQQQLIVGAAVGVGNKEFERAKALVQAGVDVLVVDTAHGHTKGVGEMIRKIKEALGVDVVGGNIATEKAAEFLVSCGVDGVKVGIGPGSICTTRVVAGVGVPQLSAIINCAQILNEAGVSLIADGGIKLSGDIVKALAAGASCVMLGSLLGACDESPGELIERDGLRWKSYRGMGSLAAMSRGSKDRYGQGEVEQQKLVPEGVEGLVESKGAVANLLFQLVGGVRAGLGYLGAANIEQLQKKAQFVQISNASLKESHAHDIVIAKKNLNY